MLVLGVLWLAVMGAQAGKPWKSKAPAEWTQKEALEVLEDSPWGRKVSLLQRTDQLRNVYRVGRRRLEPVWVEAVYGVRWSSAAVVQQALRRLGEMARVLEEMQAPPTELSPEHYVITARVVKPPSEAELGSLERPRHVTRDGIVLEPIAETDDLFAKLTLEELRGRAALRTSGKMRLKPDRVLRHGLGIGEGISFFFPRRQNGEVTLSAETEWAEFVFEGVRGEELKVKFKLKEMQVGGQPDY